jgi:hypothetical protein
VGKANIYIDALLRLPRSSVLLDTLDDAGLFCELGTQVLEGLPIELFQRQEWWACDDRWCRQRVCLARPS